MKDQTKMYNRVWNHGISCIYRTIIIFFWRIWKSQNGLDCKRCYWFLTKENGFVQFLKRLILGFLFPPTVGSVRNVQTVRKVAEPMSLSFRWQKIAKLHNRKSIWKRKIKNAMLTLWIWYCKEETKKSGIANVSLEWILRGGREGFFFFLGNKWVYRLVLSFSYGVTFLIKFYTWQILSWEFSYMSQWP